MDDNIVSLNSPPLEVTNSPTMSSIPPIESSEFFIAGIVLEYKPNTTVHDPPDDLNLVVFDRHQEMGAGLPLERMSATLWRYDELVKMPECGEELIMIAFWESESEGRTVVYHSITREDTGSSREFIADIDTPTFTVKFDVCTIVGIEPLDDHDEASQEMLDDYDPEAAQSESPDDDFTGMLPLLTDVGMLLSRRFEHTGDLADISKAISVENRLVARTPKGDPNLPGRLINLGISFLTCFECTRDLSDISGSISARERAVDLTPEGGEDMPSLLTVLGASYMSRFSLTQDLLDLSKAISAQEKAVQLQSDDDEILPYTLNDLGESLMRRFEHEGNLRDISEAILQQERGVRLTPGGDETLPGRLSNLGSSYLCRFERKGVVSDISKAVSLHQKAVDLTFAGHKDRPILLNTLGTSLMLRFERTGNRLDIEDATSALTEALRLVPEGHELAPKVCNNLGMALWGSFKHTGNISNISMAISCHQKAVSLISAPERPNSLNNLGISFRQRFEESGDLLDICEAITVLQESISLTEEQNPKMPTRLNNLATAFLVKSEHTGELADISNAIVTQQRAIHLIPEDHAAMPVLLNTLGTSLSGRFEHTKDLKDISDSISAHKRAVDSTSKDNTNLPVWLTNLGVAFKLRFEQTADPEDISKSISALKQAVNLTPDSHPYLPSFLFNLGKSLILRFKSTKDGDTISEAISAQKRAIQCTPVHHALMPSLLTSLADSFLSRFEQRGDHSDLEEAISNYRQSANGISGPPSIRLIAAKQWATWALKVNPSEPEVMAAFSTAIRLASQVAGLEQTIRIRHLNLFLNISDLSTTAAAAALLFGRHETAVEWLEQGRCLVWSQINNLRTPLGDLRDHDSVLADDFSVVSRALEKSGSRTESRIPDIEDSMRNKMSLQDEVKKHIELARRWEELLHEIRSIKGFHYFLQPPSISSLLEGVPKTGSVIIINAHATRSDAIALLPGVESAIHIPLHNLSYARSNDWKGLLNQTRSREDEEVELRKPRPVRPKRQILRKILSELWFYIVKPVLTKLDISSHTAHHSRIWWCSTGPLAFLPIHAAGIYGQDKEHSECLSDFAVSSYTPTVTALIEQVIKKPTTESATTSSFLLIGQPIAQAPLRPIPGTATEIEAIWKVLSSHGVHAIRVENEAATVVRVRDDMGIHNSIHLACHGIQHTSQPLQSGFAMRDGWLELSDIIKIQNPHADLAFLSACQTSTGDEELPEEAVHLAGGMLVAGYRGVVATMWSINDEKAVGIAKDFYSNLLSHSPESGKWEGTMSVHAAYALHHASERMRERLGDSEHALHAWVPYVHFGI